MKAPPFLSPHDEARVLDAIRLAEKGTTGEIRLCISSTPVQDSQAAARTAFERLGMHATQDRNGVLIYLAPKIRSLALVGDEGIHQRLGDAFWAKIADRLSRHFAEGSVASGLVQAIQEIGAALALHFPRTEGDTNELPDDIVSE
ncbi:MAG: TPM domain-containing protein [Limisphaerales bacterium]